MDRLKRIMKYQLKDSSKSLLITWIGILVFDVIIYLINIYTSTSTNIGIMVDIDGAELIYPQPSPHISILGSNMLVILIFLIAFSYDKYYSKFPLAINSSVRRKDFFKSMLVDNLYVAGIMAIVQGILFKIDPIFIKAIGREPLFDLQLFNTQTDSVFYIIASLFVTFLVFTSLWSMIAILNYKFTAKLWIGILVLFFISGNLLPLMPMDLVFPGNWLNVRLDFYQVPLLAMWVLIFYIVVYFTTIYTNPRDKA